MNKPAAQLEADIRAYLAARAGHLNVSTIKAALSAVLNTPVPRRRLNVRTMLSLTLR
jgi:hypothetical protein